MKLYAITADYRIEPNEYSYYVLARDRANARLKFESKILWLKIFDITEVTSKELQLEILMNPEHYIYW